MTLSTVVSSQRTAVTTTLHRLIWKLGLILLFVFVLSSSSAWARPPDTPILQWPFEGGTASELPIFKWNRVPDAMQYNLQIFNQQGVMLAYNWYEPSETGCQTLETRCSTVAPITLPPGAYQSLIRSWNASGGYSAASQLRGFSVTGSRSERYLAKLQSRQTPLIVSNARQRQIIDWVMRYLQVSQESITRETLGHMIGIALKRMNLLATQHVNDLHLATSGYDYLDLVLANPSTALWANCGDSAVFMLEALAAFNVPARQIALWSSLNDGHSLVEYYSEAFSTFVYYDPLYGAILLDDAGAPATVEDVLDQVTRFGFRAGSYDRWEFRPVRFSDVTTTTSSPAVDARYDYYNMADYGYTIIRCYMAIIARRFSDSTHLGLPLSGEDIVMGRWLMFDNSAFTEYADYFTKEFWPLFDQQYDIRKGGRYALSIVHTTAR